MKITDLIPKYIFEHMEETAKTIGTLYDYLDRLDYGYADDIVEQLIDFISAHPNTIPLVEFVIVNIANKKLGTNVEAYKVLSFSLKHFEETLKRQKRELDNGLNGVNPSDIKLAIMAHIGMPITVKIDLAKILNTGEYNFMRGAVIASEDETHFPIGIKPYTEAWFFTHDPQTGYLTRIGINDHAEARELLANTMQVEEATNLDGLQTWLSIMGEVMPPANLGKLYKTVKSTHSAKDEGVDALMNAVGHSIRHMPLWMAYTVGKQVKAPRFISKGRAAQTKVLDALEDQDITVEVDDLRYRFEEGMTRRKKIDLRRSMVNKISEQGIQDNLAIGPLEDALHAQYPLWLLMSDKQQIHQTKAEGVTQVSVAGDMGIELGTLKNIVTSQMRIAQSNKADDKQKSMALSRAVQASRAIMVLRKEAGYYELNNATKSGVFKNMDATVLQDDGAEFDSLIEQLAQEGKDDE